MHARGLRRRILPAFAALVLLAVLAAPALAADLVVSAASSLNNAFRDLAPLFEGSHPGVAVRLNFGASGTLLQQLVNGAPVDVFASADQATMNDGAAHGLIVASTRTDFVSNALVVIVPTGSRLVPHRLSDLEAPSFRSIAIGLPATVPVGRYTRAALERAGLWKALEARFVPAQNVRQALDYVARNEVEAGFVYATDAAIMPGKVSVAFAVPTGVPIVYPMAVVTGSREPALAREFIAFASSPDARRVFARWGFAPP